MSDINLPPEWVTAHQEYYGNKISMNVRHEWHKILIKEMGSDPQTVLDGVRAMIRECIKGWAEDHLKFLMNFCMANSPSCDRCNSSGLVTVPNYGTNRALGDSFKVLCTCPRGSKKRLAYPKAATITQWEDKHGPVPANDHRRRVQRDFALTTGG